MYIKKYWYIVLIAFTFGVFPGMVAVLILILPEIIELLRNRPKREQNEAVEDLKAELKFYERELEHKPEPPRMVLFEDVLNERQTKQER